MSYEGDKNMLGTRKFTLYPEGDKQEVNRVYDYIRKGQKIESQMLNIAISALYYSMLMGEDKEKRPIYNEDGTPKLNKKTDKPLERSAYDELLLLCRRTPDSKAGSIYEGKVSMEDYPVGLPIAGEAGRKADSKLKDCKKKGLFNGKLSLPTYKVDNPLSIPKMYVTPLGSIEIKKDVKNTVGIYYDTEKYPTPMSFYEALMNDTNVELFMKFCNNITFKFCLGNVKDSLYLRRTLESLFNGEIKACDSSIQVDGKKIMLNMCVDYPKRTYELNKNIVMGIDIGFIVPIMCALSNHEYKRLALGSREFINHHRIMYQKQRSSVSKSMRDNSTNGHGRNKKVRPVDEIKANESNFAKTYSKTLARKAVDYAIKNHVGVIQMENLKHISRDERQQFVLRNWGYYELQKSIEYAAEQAGIEVRYVEPAYTSQVCSICGHRGERTAQATFVCTNPDCKIHGKYKEAEKTDFDVNADFNGARNIAMSDHFVTDGTKSVELVFNEEFTNEQREIFANCVSENQTYTHCYVAGNTVSIMCDDGYWHDFDLKIVEKAVNDDSVDKLNGEKKEKKAKTTKTKKEKAA